MENQPVSNLDILDLSIVFADLGPKSDEDRAEQGFWRACCPDERMSLTGRKTFDAYHLDKPLSRDYGTFAAKIADLHKAELASIAEGKQIERPYVVRAWDCCARCTAGSLP